MTRRRRVRERKAFNRARRRLDPLGEALRDVPWSEEPLDRAWFSKPRATARSLRILASLPTIPPEERPF